MADIRGLADNQACIYANSMDDLEKVLQVLSTWHNGLSARLIADVLGWQTAPGSRTRLDTARVHRALMSLAIDKKVYQVEKRWRAVKRKENKEL